MMENINIKIPETIGQVGINCSQKYQEYQNSVGEQ